MQPRPVRGEQRLDAVRAHVRDDDLADLVVDFYYLNKRRLLRDGQLLREKKWQMPRDAAHDQGERHGSG